MLIHYPGAFSPTLWHPVETILPAPAQIGCACAPGALYSPEAVGIVITESMQTKGEPVCIYSSGRDTEI